MMTIQEMKILASDFISHPLSRGVSDCERIGEALSDATAIIAAKDVEIERLNRESSACDLLDEQKGTIKALNMALGGDESTSTENLIDSHEIDHNEEGLISLCRKLIAENIRMGDMLEEYRQDVQTTADALGHANQDIERLERESSACDLVQQLRAEVERLTRERDSWEELFGEVALSLKCLPSRFTDDNGHVLRAAKEAMEQLAAAQKDAERMDFLDSLSSRTDPSLKKCNWLNSDMHFSNKRVVIHLRNCVGRATTTGAGYSTREAIDAAMQGKEGE